MAAAVDDLLVLTLACELTTPAVTAYRSVKLNYVADNGVTTLELKGTTLVGYGRSSGLNGEWQIPLKPRTLNIAEF